MTDTNFTPGPWTKIKDCDWCVDTGGSNSYYHIGPDGCDPVAIAIAAPCFDVDSELDANAHLIAAAPDLFAALVEAEKHFGPFANITVNGEHDAEDVRVVGVIRAAISKTGAL